MVEYDWSISVLFRLDSSDWLNFDLKDSVLL